MTDTDFDRLQAFMASSTPPARALPKKTVPAINRGTLYWCGGFMAIAVIFLLYFQVIAPETFINDLMGFGGIGLLLCAIVFCLSAGGAYGYRELQARKVQSAPGWTAAVVKDRQFDAAADADFVFLELKDGRRVRVIPESEGAKAARPGDVGWASYKGERLVDFVTE